jgi:tetratricopeptide (TPR) repeat protein
MRKIIVLTMLALVLVGGGGAGWYVLRHFLHDAIASGEALLAQGDVHGATLEFRNAVRNHPENARAHVLLATAQLRAGDPVAAEKELEQAQGLNYGRPDLLPLLARAYLGQGRFRELLHNIPPGTLPPAPEAEVLVVRSLAQTALGDIDAARASATAAERLDPKLADAPLAEARMLAVAGDRVQALLKLDEALRLDPTLLEALGLKSDLLREQGNLADALATLDTAVQANPKLARVRLARARLLLLLGQDPAAREDLEAALHVEPRNALGHYLHGLLLVRADDWPGAEVDFQKIGTVLGQLPRGDYYAALIKSHVNQVEQAAELIAHYTARYPQDANGFRLLARIDLLLHNQPAAAEALKRVSALGGASAAPPPGAAAEVRAAAAGPDSAEALTQLATEQLGRGDAGDAASELAQVLETRPQPADTTATQMLSALADADLPAAQAALDRLHGDPRAEPMVVANLAALLRMANLDFTGAMALWQDAARRWPNAAALQVNLARVLDLTDHPAQSEQVLATLLTAQPAQPAALRLMVQMLAARQRPREAITYVRAARRAAPDAVPLLVTEAALDAQTGDFPAAFRVLEQVPLEQAQSPVLLSVRAQIQLAQGKTAEATNSLRQILLTHPDDQGVRQRLIRLLSQSKQTDEALRLAREGLALAPGNSALLRLVTQLVYASQGMEAAQAQAAELRRDPINLPAARLLKGMLYLNARRFDEAVAAYREELASEPFNALAIATATALASAGRPDEGVALLRDWVARQPDPMVSNELAAIGIAGQHYGQAETDLVAVLAARPNDAVALNNLAWIYQHNHDPRAQALAQRAYLLQPSAQSADTLGWILLQQGGGGDQGLLLVRRAAAAMPTDPAVLYHFAYGLSRFGEHDGAVRLLDALLRTPTRFEERDAAAQLLAALGGPPAGTAAPAGAPPAAVPATATATAPGPLPPAQ